MPARKLLAESSLARLWDQMQRHDTGFVTAWRVAEDCNRGRKFTRAENMARLRELEHTLRSKGYWTTRVQGVWRYDDKAFTGGHEESLFVVDPKDTGRLERDLVAEGRKWEQDTVMFVPKGSETGVLIPTNDCPNNPIKKRTPLPVRKIGGFGFYGASRVSGGRGAAWFEDEKAAQKQAYEWEPMLALEGDDPEMVRWMEENGHERSFGARSPYGNAMTVFESPIARRLLLHGLGWLARSGGGEAFFVPEHRRYGISIVVTADGKVAKRRTDRETLERFLLGLED